MDRLWRDDEGRGDESVEEALAAGPSSPLWRPHEGKPTAPAEPDDPAGGLWRGGEGQHAPAPRFERRASAPPGEWKRTGTRPEAARPAPQEPVPPPVESRRTRRGSVVRIALLTVLILLVLIAADGAYAGFRIKGALEDSADRLEQGLVFFEDGDVPRAEAEFRAALERAEEAHDLARHPGVAVASLLPVIDRDAEAALAVVAAGREIARAGLGATEAAGILGLDENGVAASIFENGRVALDQVRAAAPSAAETAEALERADRFLAAAPRANVPLIRTSVVDATERVEDALATAQKGRSLFRVLPKLLGVRTERRYLLILQTPSEARATGGVAGLYGILTASDGELKLGKIAPYPELLRPRKRPVDAPPWFAAAYGPQSALTEWPQANVSPNFPEVANVMTQMYEDEAGRSVDGVLAMDPVALASLMRGTGPMEVQHRPDAEPVEVTADNVVELLLHDSYLEFPTEDEQNAFLGAVVDDFWSEVQTGDIDAHGLGEGIAEAVDSQHFKASVIYPEEQQALAELGLHGAYPGTGPQTQMIFNNNYGINKVDYFLERTIDSTIELGTDGVAHVTTTVELRNGAPAGPRSLLLGLGGNGTPAGTNRMVLSFLMPEGALVTSMEVGGSPRSPHFYDDNTHPVAWYVTDIPAGREEVVTLRYDVAAVSFTDDVGEFSLAFVPQATVNPDEIFVTVIPPDGYSFEDVEGAEVGPNGEATVGRTLDETVTVSARLRQN